MRKIGIMGGTFDPIHYGHLMLAECAREECSLTEIWLIPTGCSYLKAGQRSLGPGMPTPEERLEMTALAIQDTPDYRCLDIEVKRAGYSYSYETLEALRDLYPDDEFHFIIGADCLETIATWKFPDRIFANCTLVAAVRADASLSDMEQQAEKLRNGFGAKIILLPFRKLELSSSEIRERVRTGKSLRYLTPESVISYIEDKNFYRG